MSSSREIWDKVNKKVTWPPDDDLKWSGTDLYPANAAQYPIADTSPNTIDIEKLQSDLTKLMSAIQPPAPIINCQNCAQPTLYDRACRYCGGPPGTAIKPEFTPVWIHT